MSKLKPKIDPTDIPIYLALVSIVALVVLGGWSVYQSISNRPADYRYDSSTDTATWTDSEGRKFMRSPNGSVREISQGGNE